MRKFSVVLLLLLIFIPTITLADMTQYSDGGYTKPIGWTTIATKSITSLDHGLYYYWDINDISYIPSGVNIVFHHVRDWTDESNDQLAVYLKDIPTPNATRWRSYTDSQNPSQPDWSSFTYLGMWNDPAGTDYYDVVFSIPSLADRTKAANGNYFRFGIDPDCHYDVSQITVDVAPVPEPGTMLLLGLGLLGIGIVSRKK